MAHPALQTGPRAAQSRKALILASRSAGSGGRVVDGAAGLGDVPAAPGLLGEGDDLPHRQAGPLYDPKPFAAAAPCAFAS